MGGKSGRGRYLGLEVGDWGGMSEVGGLAVLGFLKGGPDGECQIKKMSVAYFCFIVTKVYVLYNVPK